MQVWGREAKCTYLQGRQLPKRMNVGLYVPACPTIVYRTMPFPMPHIYLVSRYSLCISSLFDHFPLLCLVSVRLSTGYGPRPLVALYRQSFTPITLSSQSRKFAILSYLFDLAVLYRIFVQHQFQPASFWARVFSRSQEPDSLY